VDDRTSSIQQTADRGYIVAGKTYSFGGGNIWMLKLDAKRNLKFRQTSRPNCLTSSNRPRSFKHEVDWCVWNQTSKDFSRNMKPQRSQRLQRICPVSSLRPLRPLRLFFIRRKGWSDEPIATVEGGGRRSAAAVVYLLLMQEGGTLC
jgi:hypothetical protein